MRLWERIRRALSKLNRVALPKSLHCFWNDLVEYYKWGDPCQMLDRLATLLQFYVEFCTKHGLQYWVEFGTLLGAVRHQNLIPWDYDLDVGMPSDDFNAFCALGDQLKQVGEFTFSRYSVGCYRVYYRKAWVDIVEYAPQPSARRVLCRLPPEHWEGDVYVDHDYDTVFPLQTLRVGRTAVLAPARPAEYLRPVFGPPASYMRYPLVPFAFFVLYHPLSFWKKL